MATAQRALSTLAELAVTFETLLNELQEAEKYMPGNWSDVDAIKAEMDNVEEEYARQARIADGKEHACAACGCSESRACPGGCVWATATHCSRCA
jgi:hypothetical protein